MNIGVIVDNEYTNDIRVRNECKILSENGHSVYVLCFNFGNYTNNTIKNIDGITIHRLKFNKNLKNILFALTNTFDLYRCWWTIKIKSFIKDYRIEALHVHDLYMSKAAYYASRNSDIKTTLDLHENYPYAVDYYRWMHKPLSKYLIRPDKWKIKEKSYLSYPNKIIVLSDFFKEYLLKKYNFLNNSQFIVFPNVPSISELTSYEVDKNILDKKNCYILFYFGAISKRRGIDLLFSSLKKLSQIIPNVKLLLIGPVDKAESEWFKNKINEESISKFIIYFPWKDISTLPSYIKASDICLSPLKKNPQHESGIANKVFQYMLFEKPIIVSNCSPQESIVNDFKCGLSFEWDSVDDFIEKVNNIYGNPVESIQMGKRGKRAVFEYFNAENLSRGLLSIYN